MKIYLYDGPDLDDETLKAMGKLALEFHFFEQFIEWWAADLIGCPESELSRYFRAPFIKRQIEQMQIIICKQTKTLQIDTKLPVIQNLERQLSEADRIVNHRNAILHPLVKLDKSGRPIVQPKKAPAFHLSAPKILGLVEEIDHCATDLLNSFLDYSNLLVNTRKARKAEKRKRRRQAEAAGEDPWK